MGDHIIHHFPLTFSASIARELLELTHLEIVVLNDTNISCRPTVDQQ